jgi:hypothetical protein
VACRGEMIVALRMFHRNTLDAHVYMAVVFGRSLNEPHRWLVAKLPNNVIREIMPGAAVALRAWVVTVDDKLVLTFGLAVFDDPASPLTVFGACRSDNEAADLRLMLASGEFPIQFFNETHLPVLYWNARIDCGLAANVLAQSPSVGYPAADGRAGSKPLGPHYPWDFTFKGPSPTAGAIACAGWSRPSGGAGALRFTIHRTTK